MREGPRQGGDLTALAKGCHTEMQTSLFDVYPKELKSELMQSLQVSKCCEYSEVPRLMVSFKK